MRARTLAPRAIALLAFAGMLGVPLALPPPKEERRDRDRRPPRDPGPECAWSEGSFTPIPHAPIPAPEDDEAEAKVTREQARRLRQIARRRDKRVERKG